MNAVAILAAIVFTLSIIGMSAFSGRLRQQCFERLSNGTLPEVWEPAECGSVNNERCLDPPISVLEKLCGGSHAGGRTCAEGQVCSDRNPSTLVANPNPLEFMEFVHFDNLVGAYITVFQVITLDLEILQGPTLAETECNLAF